MADIQNTGTTKLGRIYGNSARVSIDTPGVTEEYMDMSSSDGSFTFYRTMSAPRDLMMFRYQTS